MIEFFLHEGGFGRRIVAGPFATPAEAGTWRRRHPPVLNSRGPYLHKTINGRRTPLARDDFLDFLHEFARHEQQLDTSAEAVRFP